MKDCQVSVDIIMKMSVSANTDTEELEIRIAAKVAKKIMEVVIIE